MLGIRHQATKNSDRWAGETNKVSTVAAPAYSLERGSRPLHRGGCRAEPGAGPAAEEELGAQGGGRGSRKRRGCFCERELLQGELRALQRVPPGLSAEHQEQVHGGVPSRQAKHCREGLREQSLDLERGPPGVASVVSSGGFPFLNAMLFPPNKA